MKYLYLLPLTLLATGCVQTYRLGAGLHTHDLFYQAKPLTPLDTTVATATYIGGEIMAGDGYGGGFKAQQDQHFAGLLNLSRAHSWRGGAVSYGAFGYLGNYTVGDYTFSEYGPGTNQDQKLPSIYRGTYDFSGWGLRGSAFFNSQLNSKVAWRFLGVEWAYSRETGALTDLRQQIPQKQITRSGGYDEWIIARSPSMTTIALATELEISSDRRKEKAFILKYSIGKSLPDYTRYRWFNTTSLVMAYQYHRHSFHFQFGNVSRKPAYQFGYHYQLGLKRKAPRW